MLTAAQSITLPTLIRYGDIITLGRPIHDGDQFSYRHPKMTQQHRAKIFAPFAALVGFDERIRSKEVQYESKHELDADEEWEMNRKLGILRDLTVNSRMARMNHVIITVEYYVPCADPDNDAYDRKGSYVTVTGMVRKVDIVGQAIILSNDVGDHRIAFSDIYEITDPAGRLFVQPGA